jgi:DNA-nicking Smr family endonuclease
MPPRARILSEADQTLWANYSRMIAPLSGRSSDHHPVAAATSHHKPAMVALPAATVILPPPVPPMTPGCAPRSIVAPLAVGGQPGGLDTATWQRFRSGKLPAARTLDLHGLTLRHAHQSLRSFLSRAHAEGLRCVEVVTGRGNGQIGGAIRRELPHWLNQSDIRPMVLGAAHPHASNPGSVRLLLRRVR